MTDWSAGEHAIGGAGGGSGGRGDLADVHLFLEATSFTRKV